MESAFSGLVSVFAIPFGVGVIGVVGAIFLAIAAISLATRRRYTPRKMAVQILVAGAAALFGAFPILLFSQCGIMGGGCSRHAEWIIFGVPAIVMTMNAACAVLIRRQVPPSD